MVNNAGMHDPSMNGIYDTNSGFVIDDNITLSDLQTNNVVIPPITIRDTTIDTLQQKVDPYENEKWKSIYNLFCNFVHFLEERHS